MRRRFCIFDFDGTICDSLDLFVSAINKVSALHGYPPTTSDQIRAVPARTGLTRLGVPLTQLPFLVRSVRKELAARAGSLKTFPGMVSVLAKLSQTHTLLVVTSNGKQLVETFLSENRVECFHEVHSELDVFGKARRLSKVLRKHGAHPREAVYIGDETRDVEAARKTQLASVAVSWGFNSRELLEAAEPDCIADHPEELVPCLESLSEMTPS